MIPTRRLLALVGLLLVLAGIDFALRLQSAETRLLTFWWLCVGAVLLAALLDLALSWRRAQLQLKREMPQNLSQAEWQDITLVLTSLDTRSFDLQVFDVLPESFSWQHLPRALRLPVGTSTRLRYAVRADARGDYEIPAVDVRRSTLFGLWLLHERHALVTHVRVFPDFSWLSGSLQLVGEQRMQRAGVRLTQRRGEGLEFHQLREYRKGDSPRAIDWKASARRSVLIAREFQEERDQQILFVLDTGSRMRAMDGQLAHFDLVLRAMLLLAVVALRQGDAVGLLSFGSTERWLGMQRGAGAVHRLLGALYDLQSGTSASDYLAAATAIRKYQRRRALVVLLTNAREEDEDLLPALQLLRSRHIVLVTSLRETLLDDLDTRPIDTLDDALRFAAGSAALTARQRVRDAVRRAGHILLDATPRELPVRLVHDYWQLKRSGRL